MQLDAEAWDRLITWIDLNVPDHGTWSEHSKIPGNFQKRRVEMRTRYANRPEDPEVIPDSKREPAPFVKPAPLARAKRGRTRPRPAGRSMPPRPSAARPPPAFPSRPKIELAEKVSMVLTYIPAGEFVMGDAEGGADEYPPAPVKIDQPFYMGAHEVTAEEFAAFDPSHDNGYISVFNKDQSTRGEAANRPRQPVIRVSWEEAMAFCDWLSSKTGRKFTLPTEAQWEYACRAGTATPLYYGGCDTNFAKLANLADQRLENLCRGDSPKWIPAVRSVNDGGVITEHRRPLPAQRLGAVRHARQRVGVDA